MYSRLFLCLSRMRRQFLRLFYWEKGGEFRLRVRTFFVFIGCLWGIDYLHFFVFMGCWWGIYYLHFFACLDERFLNWDLEHWRRFYTLKQLLFIIFFMVISRNLLIIVILTLGFILIQTLLLLLMICIEWFFSGFVTESCCWFFIYMPEITNHTIHPAFEFVIFFLKTI